MTSPLVSAQQDSPTVTPMLQEPLLDVEGDSEGSSERKTTLTWGSYLALCFIGLLDAIEYGVVMPSLYQYLKSMRKEGSSVNVDSSYGLIIAIFSAASMAAKPVIGYLGDRRPFMETFMWTCFVALLGNALYFVSKYISDRVENEHAGEYLLLVARILAGVGCANTSLTFAYISRTVVSEERTRTMTMMSMIKIAGFIFGPALTALTSTMNFHMGGFEVNAYNSPGLIVVVFQSLAMLYLGLYLQEPPPYEVSVDDDKDATSMLSQLKMFCSPAVAVCFYNVMFFNGVIGLLETMLNPITHQVFNWEPQQNAYVFVVITMVSVVGSILLMKFSASVKDEYFVVIAHVLYLCSAVGLKFLFFYDMQVGEFWTVVLLLSLPTAFSFSPNRSYFSKLIEKSTMQAFFSSLISIVASLGSILGPVMVGIGMHMDPMPAGKTHDHILPSLVNLYVGVAVTTLLLNVLVLFVGNKHTTAIDSDMDTESGYVGLEGADDDEEAS